MSKKLEPIVYPPYPESNWSNQVVARAWVKITRPNRLICIYCLKQAKEEDLIKHRTNCPARDYVPVEPELEEYETVYDETNDDEEVI